MSHYSELIATDIEAYLAQHERKELLRFITCGSVDDGKSTLIGRLLYDSKMIYEDTLEKICRDSAVHGTTGGGFDPALLTDGLKAEREQGITIDVAYRYFSTARRKFIIADTPGHVQYTRNMATGASTADLAVILIDARHGVLEQTRRHSFIVSLLGIRHIVVAVNKMDLVGYDEAVFERIRRDYLDFAARLDIPDLHFLPMAALHGDNLVERGPHLGWYHGPTLMEFLETVYVGSDRNLEDFRFPVQYVLRPNPGFRGFAGTIASGIVRRGDEILALPSRRTSRVRSIVTRDGELDEAFASQAVTLTLEDEVDISRGDMIVRPGNVPQVAREFDAMVVWMAAESMVPGRSYLFKQTTQTVSGSFSQLRYEVDVNTLHRRDATELGLNQIGRCRVALATPLMFDGYRRNRSTGAFIVIDRITNATVGAGMILDRVASDTAVGHWDDEPASRTLAGSVSAVTEAERAARLGQQAVTVLLTGLPGSGKSTVARGVERLLFGRGQLAVVLDGENLRRGLSRDLGFDPASRSENTRRAAEVARLVNDAGLICLLAVVAPQESFRARAAEVVGTSRFLVVHLTAPAELCRERYRSVRPEAAEDAQAAGYEPPQSADLVLDTERLSPEECAGQVVGLLAERGFLP